MSELRHICRCAVFVLAVCCSACAADVNRLPARGFVGDAEVDTTVDSEPARYFLARRTPEATPDPVLEAVIHRARAELRGSRDAIALPRIAREVSPDFAVLLLAERLLKDEDSATIRRLYAEELDEVAHGRVVPLDASEYTVLFAPGWLYRSHPETGAGFERQLGLAPEMGVQAERIESDENASIEHNALAIAEEIRNRRATGRRYIVVSASKSGPEVALALAMLSSDEAAHVSAWVNIAGVLGGSPLVDDALVAPRCWAALALFGWRRWRLDGMESMSTRVRRSALGEIHLPEHVLVVNYVPLPLSGQVSPRARGGYDEMRPLGPNDGLALTVDEIFPGGATLVEIGLDHYMSAPDIDRRTVALTRAVLRQIAGRAAAHAWPRTLRNGGVEEGVLGQSRGLACNGAQHSGPGRSDEIRNSTAMAADLTSICRPR